MVNKSTKSNTINSTIDGTEITGNGTENTSEHFSTTNNTDNTDNTSRTDNPTATLKPKSNRGRKPGSKNKPKSSEETISLQEEKTFINPDKKSEYKSNSKKKYYTETEAAETAAFLINTMQQFAVALLGNEAALTPPENMLLAYSLPTYLSNIQASTVEKTQSILVPLAAIAGVTLYGVRLSSLYIEKREQNNPKKSAQKTNNSSYTTSPDTDDYSNEYPVVNPIENTENNIPHNYRANGIPQPNLRNL